MINANSCELREKGADFAKKTRTSRKNREFHTKNANFAEKA